MKKQEIGLARLMAQRLTGPLLDTPAEVVRHMLAMQAQDYNGALWAIGVRTKDGTKSVVEQAIANREIVRTWPMRGTLHFLHADDVHWVTQLLAPRATAAAKSRRIKQLGLTDTIVQEAETVLRTTLRGGNAIVRNQVAGLLAAKVRGIPITNQHTQHLMRNFGERGIICFGPNAGKQPTFVLLDEWVPKPAALARDKALRELALRYVRSHGPATLKDFAGWAMLTMGDAKTALAAAEPHLATAELDGSTYFYDAAVQAASDHPPLLLPGFDEYVLGYKDRSAVLDPGLAHKIVPGGNGMFLPTIVDKGQIVGTWKRQLRSRDVCFSYEYFDESRPADTAASESRYRAFVLGG